MTVVMIISVIIVFAVVLLAVLTTGKAYNYKHTIDELPPIDESSNGDSQKPGTDL
ncbi:YtzI protein [Bacillus sp. DNRA2]|uniref:YtzI protein n=1 Tax=Bacillus sp. DNRA2 TaxID=2723053 RepID=UPI00145C4BA3|nr:YtzI protein [Bacillus sp. DNRA2]NMD72133.1 YtzI protein [Bacillus sp. DNRA2]